MAYIVIDTCIWIELTSKPPLHPLLVELGKYLKPPHKLVLPESVKIEFDRNRKQATESWARSIESNLKQIHMLARHIPGLQSEIAQIESVTRAAISSSEPGIHNSLSVSIHSPLPPSQAAT